MSTITIKLNPAQLTGVFVSDIGRTITTLDPLIAETGDERAEVGRSDGILELLTDDTYGVGSSTLKMDIDGVEVGQSQIESEGLAQAISTINHEDLDTLAHELIGNAYTEIIYGNARNVEQVIVWATPAKLVKLREDILTYGAGNRVTEAVSIIYAEGVELYRQTEIISYTGSRVTSVSQAKT